MLRLATRSTVRPIRRVRSVVSDSKQRQRDLSVAEKFNLATLNDGKNPFDVSSNRLLNPKQAPKKTQEMKELYSLDYLMGKKSSKTEKKNPFEVASSKLM